MITLTKLVFTTDFKYVSQTQGLTMGLSNISNGDFILTTGKIFLHQIQITCIALQFYWIGLDDHGASALFAKLHFPPKYCSCPNLGYLQNCAKATVIHKHYNMTTVFNCT